jgi:UDP-N-acetyl-D-mannosaminuronate dehydrogenase
MSSAVNLVVGLGEIGKPMLDHICRKHDVRGVDIDPVELDGECNIMHVCFPFTGDAFAEECARYIRKYTPSLTIIHSTVAPGTTRAVHKATGGPVVHSPVRGKHIKMSEDLFVYTKFVGGIDAASSERAASHLRSIGMKTRILPSPEATEIAKLTETTYFGVMIAWAQEVERYCDTLGVGYDDVVSFYEEISFFPPVKYTPGIIGGHCVMPNIAILRKMFTSDILDAIEKSNKMKIGRKKT